MERLEVSKRNRIRRKKWKIKWNSLIRGGIVKKKESKGEKPGLIRPSRLSKVANSIQSKRRALGTEQQTGCSNCEAPKTLSLRDFSKCCFELETFSIR